MAAGESQREIVILDLARSVPMPDTTVSVPIPTQPPPTITNPILKIPQPTQTEGRPSRFRRPNPKYDAATWDLTTLYVPLEAAIRMISVVATKNGSDVGSVWPAMEYLEDFWASHSRGEGEVIKLL